VIDPATDREQSSSVLKFEFAPVQISGEHHRCDSGRWLIVGGQSFRCGRRMPTIARAGPHTLVYCVKLRSGQGYRHTTECRIA